MARGTRLTYSRLAAAALLSSAAALALATCGPDEPLPEPTLQLMASPTRAPADGTTIDLTVIAMEADGSPGQGSAVIRVPIGEVNGSPGETTVVLENGRGTATYACDLADDPGCTDGKNRLSALWKDVLASATVEFFKPNAGADAGTPPDAGAPSDGGEADGGIPPDASTEPPDASEPPDATTGPSDAGSADAEAKADAGSKADASLPFLSVTASKARIFMRVGDYSDVVATLRDRPDGGAIPGEEIEFSTPLGSFSPDGTGTDLTNPVTVPTNDSGAAKTRFMETGTAGVAEISARHKTTGLTAKVSVEIVAVQQITHVSTICNGQACTIMGIKGSGFNEQAQVTFKVVDSSNRPAVGAAVTFSIDNPPEGTTVAPTGVTNAQGLVTVTVSAGSVIGAFNVRAVVIEGQVETRSNTIGIRGALPANKGFTLQCLPVNVGAYVSPVPPASFKVKCDVKLVDRYNNPVGTGTSVNFKVEAGSIPNDTPTKKYSPSGSNSDEGTGMVEFDTQGTWPAVDVEPLEAAPEQWPYARIAEPKIQDGALVRNPRDGLISILGYVRGEEFFEDNNSNGTWDQGEMFIDQGEPFVDANDNGQFDPGEVYIDEAPKDAKWSPPNGKWDNTTTIWVEARVLVTGRPVPHSDYSFAIPDPFFAPKGGGVILDAWFADLNLNRPQASGTGFSAAFATSPGKGSVGWKSGGLQDGYGFDLERKLVSASDEKACTSATAVCKWKLLFKDWGRGYCGWAQVGGGNDDKPPVGATVNLTATVLQGGVVISVSGTIQ